MAEDPPSQAVHLFEQARKRCAMMATNDDGHEVSCRLYMPTGLSRGAILPIGRSARYGIWPLHRVIATEWARSVAPSFRLMVFQ